MDQNGKIWNAENLLVLYETATNSICINIHLPSCQMELLPCVELWLLATLTGGSGHVIVLTTNCMTHDSSKYYNCGAFIIVNYERFSTLMGVTAMSTRITWTTFSLPLRLDTTVQNVQPMSFTWTSPLPVIAAHKLYLQQCLLHYN